MEALTIEYLLDAEPRWAGPCHSLAPATYLHEEQTHDEGTALAVAHLPVHQRVCLQGDVSVRAVSCQDPARTVTAGIVDSACSCGVRSPGW